MGFNSGFKGLTNVTAKYAPLSCQSWGLSWTNEQGCVALLNCEDVTAPFCNWHSAQNFNSVSCHNCKDTDLGDSRFPQWLILRLRSFPSVAPYYLLGTRLRLKCDGTRAETRFRLSAKRSSPFKSPGGVSSVWLLAAEVCASAVVMLDTPCSEILWRVLATHSIRQFPLHFPSRASPCAITLQLDSTKVLEEYASSI